MTEQLKLLPVESPKTKHCKVCDRVRSVDHFYKSTGARKCIDCYRTIARNRARAKKSKPTR